MIPLELFNFAYLPCWYDHLDELARLAMPEPWRFKENNDNRKNTRTPVLERYIYSVFRALSVDHQNARTQAEADTSFVLREEYAYFNTGLLNRFAKPIYMYFERNKREWSPQEYYFKGFVDENAPRLMYSHILPQRPFANFTPDVSFSADWDIRVNTEHILQDPVNVERIPDDLRPFKNLFLLLEAGVMLAGRIAAVKPGVVVSQMFHGRVQFLLPLCLADMDRTDLAMTITPADGFYVGNTCLTLEMSYSNARLLAQPTAPWLTALVE